MAPHQILPTFAWKRLGDLEIAFKNVFLKTADTKAKNVSKIKIGEKMTRVYLREFEVTNDRPIYMLPMIHYSESDLCVQSNEGEDVHGDDQPSSQPSNARDATRVFFCPSQALSVFMAWLITKFDLSSEKERKVSNSFVCSS